MPHRVKRLLNADVILAFGIGGILLILLFPLPTLMLDMLLVLNISVSVLLLLLMFYLRNPLELSSFPALLLVLTLFRLSLNVASTKLILLHARAGSVIDAFGRFVVGNNYVVGAVVFLILVMIQFIVITKGAGRIAEVAARFTLDAMPGKQMSIDADLNAGLIDEEGARARRAEVSDEADFYGAMDGASKFVKGDAVAGLIITGTNIVGGLAVGMLQQDLGIFEALQTYTILTIGDGLVSQIPALIISVASGILVTKTGGKENLGTHLSSELFSHHEPLLICSVMLLVLAILPGLPFFPFLVMAGGSAGLGVLVKDSASRRSLAEGAPAGAAAVAALPPAEKGRLGLPSADQALISEPVLPMIIEIGFSLVPLADASQGGDLVERVKAVRQQIMDHLGVLIPPVSVRDNIELQNNEYRILVRGLEKARGKVYPGSVLAIDPGGASSPIEGVRVKDPAFGFDAVWINEGRKDAAESLNYTVVDAASVVITHVTRVVSENASDLLSRQTVSKMIDKVKESDPAVVDELLPERLSIGVIHRVLQYLLAEAVPIHDLPAVLEILADHAEQSKDPALLAEFCRQALKGHLVSSHLTESGSLLAITLHPELEEEIRESLTTGPTSNVAALSPERIAEINVEVENVYHAARAMNGSDLVLLVSPAIRLHLRHMVERKLPDLAVLSFAEVDENVSLRVQGTVKLEASPVTALA